MAARLGQHIRGNVVGYVALFVALGGTAYANHPSGNNTIDSGDIIDKAVKSVDVKQDTLRSGDIENGTIASVDVKQGALKSGDIKNGTVQLEDLAIAPATQFDLASHKSSADHDGRYFTEGELQSSDGSGPNAGANFVHWNVLSGVPADFADGVDNSGGGSATDVNCSGCVGTSDIQNLAVTLAKLGFDPATQAELDELQSAGTINEAGNPVDWTKLKNVPAGFADGVDDTVGGGGGWLLSGNAGTDPATDFLGTTDNRPLNLRVNNTRALRLEPVLDRPNLIGGSAQNAVTAGVHGATISGGGHDPLFPGTGNLVTDNFGTIGGGETNQVGDDDVILSDESFATVGGGIDNTASARSATVGGGDVNTASGRQATVGGGNNHTASGIQATVGGGGSNDAGALQATVGGGQSNTASGTESTVAGGDSNGASGIQATVGGGTANSAGDIRATVSGGGLNRASAPSASVGGGASNTASGNQATVAGGDTNTASGGASTVGGGGSNQATAFTATVAGGQSNTASGVASTVPGGELNMAAGDYSFAAGRQARTNSLHDGAFVFADSRNFPFPSGEANEFAVRATGGARFVSAIDGSGAQSAGVRLAPGEGSWSSLSDRASKTAIEPVSGRQVLDKLAELPLSTWSYRAQGKGVRHIGPMAQDFARAFGVGKDERYITSIDADGVALAAIKGLNERVEALGGGSPAPGAGPEASGLSISPAALAAIAALALTMAAALGAALALRWSGRLGGPLAAS